MNFDKFELIDDLVDIAINEDLKNGDPSSEIILKNSQSKSVSYTHLRAHET